MFCVWLLNGADEALDEAIGLGRADRRPVMVNVVKRQVEFVRVHLSAAELTAIVGQDG